MNDLFIPILEGCCLVIAISFTIFFVIWLARKAGISHRITTTVTSTASTPRTLIVPELKRQRVKKETPADPAGVRCPQCKMALETPIETKIIDDRCWIVYSCEKCWRRIEVLV